MHALIERFCARTDLSTYDPYDVWKMRAGLFVKDLYNRRRLPGTVPAALLTAFDLFVNNRRRMFYKPQEYPIVRAFAALALLNLDRGAHSARRLEIVREHLRWLEEHRCTGYSGCCWGLGFPYPVTKRIFYGENTPLATMTPYALEAFVAYREKTRDDSVLSVIRGVYDFFERDIRVMRDTGGAMATSYGPFEDRIVVNAVSYTMYSYALMLPFLRSTGARAAAETRIRRLYTFVAANQRPDGSWMYSPEGRSFIDCFHSCIVLKNLVKTNRLIGLPGASSVIQRGYAYVTANFRDRRSGLYRRFTVANKPGVIRYDLYDNAEMLNLAAMTGDHDTVRALLPPVTRTFCDGGDVWSQIDIFGARRNRNTLRWAVMPFVYALSQLG